MLPLLIMAVGAAMSAKDQYEAGEAQFLESRRAAVISRIAARQRAQEFREEGEAFSGQQRAGYAKSGVLIDSGSPLLAVMDTVVRAERNAIRTESQGDEQHRALSIQGKTQLDTASSAATSTLVSAAGSAMSMYGKAQANTFKPST
jgi:hypothetical protein